MQSKVKSLVWRACRDALPSKQNLVKRKILTDATLSVHALFKCPKISALWEKVLVWKADSLKRCPNFIDLLGCIFVENRDPELFSTVIWFLWNQRNNLRLGKRSIPLDQVLQQARNKLQEFKSAQTRTGTTSTSHSSSQWQPPTSSVYKINFDGALLMKEQRAGIRVAILNENGLIMVSSSQQIPLPGTVVEVEALAARKALELALDCGLDRVILEGDCEILMKTLQIASKSLAQFEKIVEDIRVYASMF